MSHPEGNQTAWAENRARWPLLILVTLALGWILEPLSGTILWSAIIALLFAPVYRGLLARMQRRRTLAALVTLTIVIVIVIVPFALLTASLANEAATVYKHIESGEWNVALYFHRIFDALPDPVMALLDRFGMADFPTLQRRLTAALAQGSQFIAKNALSIGQNSFGFVASLFIMLYLAFFLIRDGEGVARAIRQAIPLAPAHKRELLAKFATVIRATVKGGLLVAAIQGALGGVAFWFLGVNAALLWAVLMAFLSLLPAVGAALVWGPVAIYLFMTGAIWQSVAGGMAVFGINGFVIGPAIAAMFFAVWHIEVATRSGVPAGTPGTDGTPVDVPPGAPNEPAESGPPR
ncbi:AI-2E family transporter [Candidatus Skiveiella danica]|uniref:AI-2E family transporter n=1 Tax=Candidatus Skiveiella danica TaxID=3386177 RepID=UPI001D59B680|nr:AI-2E family transporter [Betaproteobacteria bacterium]